MLSHIESLGLLKRDQDTEIFIDFYDDASRIKLIPWMQKELKGNIFKSDVLYIVSQ